MIETLDATRWIKYAESKSKLQIAQKLQSNYDTHKQ